MKILWVSRHAPQTAQVAALENRFGQVEILLPTGDPSAPTWATEGQITGWTLPSGSDVARAIKNALAETGAEGVLGAETLEDLSGLER